MSICKRALAGKAGSSGGGREMAGKFGGKMTWLPPRRLARRLFCVRGFCPRWRVAPPKLNTTVGGRGRINRGTTPVFGEIFGHNRLKS